MKHILVVEDTEDDVFFLKRALKAAGITIPVQVAVDGQQALDYLSYSGAYADRERYPLPFLVLLDLKLPYIMGFDVLRWIRQQPPLADVKVVVLSSSQQEADIQMARTLGCNSYLVKPVTAEKLASLMQSLEEGRVDAFLSPSASQNA
ncbi:Response regulator receiver domain-containing protein [Verrucomicrobium sp. GAS474]|uniref:response regulator n=1 Tax=Verrucomicrobium sp. GAS474 TaxID=1882831 RepID=UPI00087AA8BD|nr:response regulator [Verrucomicrobium sp. GAS474]SDT89951.1 Response regulator receiver domain-containing protein [Verrucomicrobium sp. GAS474]